MAIRLFPRLNNPLAKQMIARLTTAGPDELEEERALLFRGLTWAPTGGTPIDKEPELAAFRRKFRETAEGLGYRYGTQSPPLRERDPKRGQLDFALARTIHTTLPMSPYEAAQPGVWMYMSCILAPELIRWRFSDGENTHPERFSGSKQRNVFSRLWWRAELLYDPDATDPYWLVEKLGEDEQVQIMERSSAPGYRPLARAIGRNLIEIFDEKMSTNRSFLLREMMKRLVRLLPMIRFESLDDAQIDDVIHSLFLDTLRALGVQHQVEVKQSPATDEPLPDPLWIESALSQRYLLVSALDDKEIQRLNAIADEKISPWFEVDRRWRLLFQLSRPCSTVLEALGVESQQRVASALNCRNLLAWLVEEPAGSWVTGIEPDRGRILLQNLQMPTMRVIAQQVGWSWDLTVTPSAAQLELRRRFNGDWRIIVDALSEEEMKLIQARAGVKNLSGEALRQAIGVWLAKPPAPVAAIPAPPPVEPTTAPLEAPIATPSVVAPAEPAVAPIPEPTPEAAAPEAATAVLEAADEPQEEPSSPPEPDTPEPAAALEIPDDDPRFSLPIPEPPGLLQNTLRRLDVTTLGALLDLDIQEIDIPGVGKKKLLELATYREEVLRQHGLHRVPEAPVDPEPATSPDEMRLPRAPGMIRNLLRHLEIDTLPALLRFDSAILRDMPRVGPTKQRVFAAWQKQMAEAHGQEIAPLSVQAAVEEQPERSTTELIEALWAEMDERRRLVFDLRYRHENTLQEIGDAVDLTRERIRQILLTTTRHFRWRHGLACQSALNREYRLNELGARLLHRPLYQGEGEPLPVGMLQVLAEVATGEPWYQVNEETLFQGEGRAFQGLQAQVLASVEGRLNISPDDLAQLVQHLDLPLLLVEVVLTTAGPWERAEDGTLLPDAAQMRRYEWLDLKMREQEGSVHQSEAAVWLMDREGVPPEARGEKTQNRYAIQAEQVLDRMKTIYRYQRGSFIHHDVLGLPQEKLDAVVEFCVTRLRGETGPFSTWVLLDEASEAKVDIVGITPHLLKDLLSTHPEILPLRKFLVGYAATFQEEEGIFLQDRLRNILRDADRPLLLEEVVAALSQAASYSIHSIRQGLHEIGAHKASFKGGYVLDSEEE